jgi:ArsR family transcriptional regulator, arsenate/arsenite/antimonite-responsive transcriptional repressor
MESFLAITRALSDENRVRALLALGDQEVCECQLIELLRLAPSTVSKHMSILKQAGLVKGHKKGRWMYYRLPGTTASPIIRQALSWVRQAASKAPRIRMDSRRMEKILRTNRDMLCERQSTRRKLRGNHAALGPKPSMWAKSSSTFRTSNKKSIHSEEIIA